MVIIGARSMFYELTRCRECVVVWSTQPNVYGFNFHSSKYFIEIQLAAVGCLSCKNPIPKFFLNALLPLSTIWRKSCHGTCPLFSSSKRTGTETTQVVALLWTKELHFRSYLPLGMAGSKLPNVHYTEYASTHGQQFQHPSPPQHTLTLLHT